MFHSYNVDNKTFETTALTNFEGLILPWPQKLLKN